MEILAKRVGLQALDEVVREALFKEHVPKERSHVLVHGSNQSFGLRGVGHNDSCFELGSGLVHFSKEQMPVTHLEVL
jgi:hypothetical protein